MGLNPVQLVRRRVGQALLRAAREIFPPPVFAYTMDDALRRAAARSAVRTIVDVGASNGQWTQAARRHFRAQACLLIEAQARAHGEQLRALRARSPEIDYVLAAAGNRVGTVHFDASDPLGGMASDIPFPENDIAVPMTTVDAEVARRGLGGPFLVKLDTHGFEVPILEGAARTLRETEVLVVEAYNFELNSTCLRFHELCGWLEERGFRCIDACDLMHRPNDGVLWQLDLVFAPKTRPEFVLDKYE